MWIFSFFPMSSISLMILYFFLVPLLLFPFPSGEALLLSFSLPGRNSIDIACLWHFPFLFSSCPFWAVTRVRGHHRSTWWRNDLFYLSVLSLTIPNTLIYFFSPPPVITELVFSGNSQRDFKHFLFGGNNVYPITVYLSLKLSWPVCLSLHALTFSSIFHFIANSVSIRKFWCSFWNEL